jgi:ABC-2 type transport system ATP-binding protein
VIEFRGVTKRYGATVALDDVSVVVEPGAVTGLLGPNGAGKSSAMRVLLGLDRPSVGEALIGGKRYVEIPRPMRVVGAHLDVRSAHPGRSAQAHLLALARFSGVRAARVREVLDEVGLSEVARQRVGRFSLGMTQRLGIASALLGEPEVLVLDEPVNGLDTDGVQWLRELLRGQAAAGRTVLLSSHLLTELQQVADHVVVLGRGRLLHAGSVASLTAEGRGVRVRTADTSDAVVLATRLRAAGASVRVPVPDVLHVSGIASSRVGDAAFDAGVRLHELVEESVSLEEGYMALVAGAVEFGARVKEGPR